MRCINFNSILVSQKEEANKHYEKKAAEIRAESNRTLQRAIDLASIKGASTWLTARPLLKFSTVCFQNLISETHFTSDMDGNHEAYQQFVDVGPPLTLNMPCSA